LCLNKHDAFGLVVIIANRFFIRDNKIMKTFISIVIFSTLILTACQTDASSVGTSGVVSSFSSSSSVAVESSSSSVNPIVFNDSILYGLNERQVFEIAYARDRLSPSPAVLFIHGGSWATGDKAVMRRYMAEIVAMGFVYVSMNYRLIVSGATYLSMLQDIHDVIETLKTSANTFKIDITQMAIVGESAGAHLGLLYSYREESPIPIDFMVALVPPLDFTDPSYLSYGNTQLQLFLANALMGTNVADEQAILDQGYPPAWLDASPINHLENAIPTLLGYGGKDELIPQSNFERFLQLASELDKPIESVFFPNSGHDLSGDEEAMALLTQKFSEYLTTYLA
jgi:acetyl esterase/lipase